MKEKALLILFSAFLMGCTFQSLVISRLDYFAYQYIDFSLDLSDKNSQFIKKRITHHWNYLKCNHLDEIAREYKQTAVKFTNKTKKTIFDDFIKKWFLFVLDLLLDDIAALVQQMTTKEWQSLQSFLTERNDKYIKRSKMSLTEYLEDEQDRITENFKNVYGSFENKTQESEIIKHMSRPKSFYKNFVAERESYQKLMLTSLQKEKNPNKIKAMIKNWANNPELLREGNFREQYLQNKKEWQIKMVGLHNLTTQKQRDFFVGKLLETHEDLLQLIAERECPKKTKK